MATTFRWNTFAAFNLRPSIHSRPAYEWEADSNYSIVINYLPEQSLHHEFRCRRHYKHRPKCIVQVHWRVVSEWYQSSCQLRATFETLLLPHWYFSQINALNLLLLYLRWIMKESKWLRSINRKKYERRWFEVCTKEFFSILLLLLCCIEIWYGIFAVLFEGDVYSLSCWAQCFFF